MKKMLPITILENNIKYNDDIQYVDGDNIFEPTKDLSHTAYTNKINYINYIIDTVAENNQYQPLIFKSFQKNYDVDTKPFTSTVYHKIINLNAITLCCFKNIKIIYYNDNIEIAQNRYDSVNYYAHTDFLEIPKSIYDYIMSGNTIPTNIAIYNFHIPKDPNFLTDNIRIPNVPNLHFEYIPEKITYSTINKMITGQIKSNYDDSIFYYTFIDLPKSIYNQVYLDCQTLAFDTQENIFYGHSNANQTKLNVLCQDIAKNGLKKPIQLRLMNDNVIFPYFSNKRILMAKYLDLPSIPACIIYNQNQAKLDINNLYNVFYKG